MPIDKPHKIYAENLEPSALEQFQSAMALDCVVQGALMPDAHTGYSLPIGAVMATRGKVFPSWVGYDISCGVLALPTTYKAKDVRSNAKAIFDALYRDIPTGFQRNGKPTRYSDALEEALAAASPAGRALFKEKDAPRQLGSLGSGNHFLEVGEGSDGRAFIVIHSGSRGVGHAVATQYMKLAAGDGHAREGHFGFDLGTQEFTDYMVDQHACLEFALANRLEMAKRAAHILDRHCGSGSAQFDLLVNRNHNHAEEREDLIIHRKGATHAEEGMMGVIPGNMRDGSFIVRGLGNPDSLFSSSHGAGRVMGRKKAVESLTMEAFKDAMEGITARVKVDTLDESPGAYKDIFEVMRLQAGLVEVVEHIKTIVNMKGVEEPRKHEKKAIDKRFKNEDIDA